MASKPSPTPMVWDSCVLIDCLDESPIVGVSEEERQAKIARREAAKALEQRAIAGQFLIVVSSMAIAELVFGDPARDDNARIIGYLRKSWFNIRAFDVQLAHCARILRRSHKLWGEDAAHVATAVANGIPELITTDGVNADDWAEKKREAKRPLLPLNGLIRWERSPPLQIKTPRQKLDEIEQEDAARVQKFSAKEHGGGKSEQSELQFDKERDGNAH